MPLICSHAWTLFTGFVTASMTPLSVQAAEQDYEKEKLNERIAKLSGGVAVIQVRVE